MSTALHIPQEDMAELISKVRKLSLALPDKEVKKAITRASKPYIVQAQKSAPVLSEPKKRYNTPKVSQKLKAPKGMGRVVATYMPGNLGRSIRKLAASRLTRAILIGPKKEKRDPTGVFSGRRVDGYYAAMVEGGTKNAAPKPFLAPAWESSRIQVLQNIETELTKMINTAI